MYYCQHSFACSDAFENHMAITILRAPEGFDISHLAQVAAIGKEALSRSTSTGFGGGHENQLTHDPTDPDFRQSAAANGNSKPTSLEPAKLKGNKLVFANGGKKGKNDGIAGYYRYGLKLMMVFAYQRKWKKLLLFYSVQES